MHFRNRLLASLHCLQLFAQAVKVKRLVEQVALDPKINFWVYTTNVLLNESAIQWSKVFGSTKEQTHWTRSFSAKEQEAVREALYSHLGLTTSQWRDYRKTILDFRDQMAAHHDLNAAIQKYPHFDIALAAADLVYKKLLEKIEGDPGHALAWQGLLRWADHVSQNMRPVVTKSFEASSAMFKRASAEGPKPL